MRSGYSRKLFATCALSLLISVGSLPLVAQQNDMRAFRVQLNSPLIGSETTLKEVGDPVYSCFGLTSSRSAGHMEFLGRVIEVLSIRPQAVVLRIRMKYFDHYVDSDQARNETMKVEPREITYIPGQEISFRVEGYGPPIIISGSIVDKPEPRIVPAALASFLPKVDELLFSNLIFLRDRQEVILGTNPHEVSFGRCKEDDRGACAITIYIPKHGLFVFSLKPMEGATEGLLDGSQLSFEEGGHSYLLCSSLPITGGDLPGKVWVQHLKDFLPSQHCGSKSADDLKSIGSTSANAESIKDLLLRRDVTGECL
jgi:hypothetical protein